MNLDGGGGLETDQQAEFGNGDGNASHGREFNARPGVACHRPFDRCDNQTLRVGVRQIAWMRHVDLVAEILGAQGSAHEVLFITVDVRSWGFPFVDAVGVPSLRAWSARQFVETNWAFA